jgi:signal transduction histidine kinase
MLSLGVPEMLLSWQENSARTTAIQGAQAQAAAERVGSYLALLEKQVRAVAAMPWGSKLLDRKSQHAEFARLMRREPAIAEVLSIDSDDREVLFLSRIEVDRIGALLPLVADPRVVLARTSAVAYGTPYYRQGDSPFVSLSVAATDASREASVVEISLKFIADLMTSLPLEREAVAWIVDAGDGLLTHPRSDLVLKRTKLDSLPLVLQARKAFRERPSISTVSLRGMGPTGDDAVVSAARVEGPDWIVFVEQPSGSLLSGVRASALRLTMLLVATLVAAALVSRWLALRLTRPIGALMSVTQAFGKGEMSRRVDVRSGDEVEALAATFNSMADQIGQYMGNLEGLVAEKTRELAAANAHKSEFLANVSHELRTPLNAVIGMSEALDAELFGPLSAKQREYVSDIHESGRHLLALINDLLDLAKIESGRMDIEPVEFDLRTVLESALVLVRERAVRAGLEVRLEIEPDIDRLCADERRFKQIVLNLLSNAVKFTRPGGEVVLSARQTESELTIAVRDTGVGIAQEDIATLFEEFRQLRTAGVAAQEGTGLGLALTKRLVELHRGTITVESELGKGSTFTVTLPRLDEKVTS